MPIQKSLKDAMLTGNGLVSWRNNTPMQYSGKQRQYFSPETRTFTQEMARYASDFVEGQVQGLDPNAPLEWQTRLLRMADIVKPTAAIQRDFDDYKMILFADRDIEYVMPGAKIVTMGSTWLVVNPVNISGSDGCAVVRRCNAVWNFLDFFGNVISEPILVENSRANANDSDAQQSLLIAKGYFNVICQYNDYTKQIDTNTRMILGTGAYRVTGYSDFDQEYTGNYATVRTLSFSVRYEEANKAIDDMENHVAGGKTFAWDISIVAPDKIRVGTNVEFEAESSRNGKLVTDEDPFIPSYRWKSSDTSVLRIDSFGRATAIAEGTATVTATLAQNKAYSESVTVSVTESEDGVAFTTTPVTKLGAYDNCTISAAYFEDGTETTTPLSWTLTGADATSFAYTEADDGKSVSIECFGYSAAPLIVTAAYGDFEAQVGITLEGF